jgi:hypothetical protein
MTKEQIEAIGEDIAKEIAAQSVIDFANMHWPTVEEGEYLDTVIYNTAKAKILLAFGGFAE